MKGKLFAVLTVAVLVACSDSQNFNITGCFDEPDGTVYYLIDENREVVDSAVITDGKFYYSGQFTGVVRYYVTDKSNYRASEIRVPVFIEPGDITIDFNENNDFVAGGTALNDAYVALLTKENNLTEMYYSETDPVKRSEIETQIDELLASCVADNLDNPLGLYTFQSELFYNFRGQELLDELARFSDGMKATETWKNMVGKAEKQMAVDDGKPYIDFAQKSPEGVEISLKSVVENPANRYVLLDFWASWCGPCMGEVPFLLEDYAKYKPLGFEIFGSSLDKDGNDWVETIANRGMDWVHVSSLNYWDNEAAALYAVSSIPSNFLIDCSTGLIVAHGLRGTDLGDKLKELLLAD